MIEFGDGLLARRIEDGLCPQCLVLWDEENEQCDLCGLIIDSFKHSEESQDAG
jgi:predicted amidophosphoribosyltransferase